jgi:hypothetical protein
VTPVWGQWWEINETAASVLNVPFVFGTSINFVCCRHHENWLCQCFDRRFYGQGHRDQVLVVIAQYFKDLKVVESMMTLLKRDLPKNPLI